MKRLLIILCISTIFFTSCREIFGKRIRGDGNIKTESRSVGDFTGVDVSGSIDLYVKQDSTRSVKIEADENLLPYIVVENDGSKLLIHSKNGYNLNPSRDIKVSVSSPLFRSLEASGACDIFSENKLTSSEHISIGMSGSCEAKIELNAPRVEADLSGACSIQLKGETKDFNVGGSGSTTVKSFDLMAENVDVDISGAGDAEVYASQKLKVDVSGAGGVKYKGNATVNQSVSGAGSVQKVD